jgi:hypothetical protein
VVDSKRGIGHDFICCDFFGFRNKIVHIQALIYPETNVPSANSARRSPSFPQIKVSVAVAGAVCEL